MQIARLGSQKTSFRRIFVLAVEQRVKSDAECVIAATLKGQYIQLQAAMGIHPNSENILASIIFSRGIP